jgi:two-component system, OmpR family, sensor kinase
LKPFEKESFVKSLALYFVSIEILVTFVLYHSYREEVTTMQQQLFLEMKNFNFNFQGEKFEIDFVKKRPDAHLLELQQNASQLYALFPVPTTEKYLLKIYYDKHRFADATQSLRHRYLLFMLLISAVVGAMSYGFARYTLRPLRSALALTDRFIKDIIHDLNTPVSAILVNTSMLPRDDKAVQRIEKSAQSIGMLYRNLQEYQGGLPQQRERFRLDTLAETRLAFFRSLYPTLSFQTALSPTTVTANPDALTRILDNLFSNACKYNRSARGEVAVTLAEHTLRVTNTTDTPIRAPHRLFERFYKENERGIGIGLHIVRKLCDEEHISLTVSQENGRVTFTCRFEPAAEQA